MINDDIVIIIPAYNPDDKFITFLAELREAGYRKIIVIDDGSVAERKHYFEQAKNEFGCHLVVHGINLGQGRAYKSGFNYYLSNQNSEEFEKTLGLIQCDCDGQHHIEDVNRCVDLLRDNQKSFILGVRDFSSKNVPFRSRFGNKYTSFIFKVFCGMDIKDTQTGLKGIPRFLIPTLMETSGERFEYASSVLLKINSMGINIIQFPIQTIYIDGNATSHFNPVRDSIRIYSVILKYMMSSLTAFIVDIVLFSVFINIFKPLTLLYYIIISTYLAKILSCTYTYLVNKNIVFGSKGNTIVTSIKFITLCIVQSSCAAFLIRWVVFSTRWNEILCKIIVETILFFVSFQVQKRWIFVTKCSD